MSAVIVDTNVPVVANRNSQQASNDCVINCTKELEKIKNRKKIVLDDKWLILREYMQNLRQEGQPGVGDAFLKWILTNHRNPERCELISITPLEEQNNFKEFPSDPRLIHFDPSDKIFIALANAHSKKPPILQAVDAKWWSYRDILRENGIKVNFLCPQDIART